MAAIVARAGLDVLGWGPTRTSELLKIAWNEICVTGTRSGGSLADSCRLLARNGHCMRAGECLIHGRKAVVQRTSLQKPV
jgi:hypothetical protein